MIFYHIGKKRQLKIKNFHLFFLRAMIKFIIEDYNIGGFLYEIVKI